MIEIPKPTDTGSAGTQLVGTGEIATGAKESPFLGLPIIQRLEGLATTHSRSMGGEVAANLLAGSFSQISHDLQTTRQELRETRIELKQTLEELSKTKTRAAVLEERVNAAERDKHLKYFSITAGTVLIGIGIELYRNNFDKSGYIAGGFGLLLVIFSWFSRMGGSEK